MKIEHTTIRNGALFCLNCGQKTPLSLPIEISKLSKKIRAFNLLHEDCPKTWEEPKPNQKESIEQRANFWFEHGERGLSSEAIFCFFSKSPDIQTTQGIPQISKDALAFCSLSRNGGKEFWSFQAFPRIGKF